MTPPVLGPQDGLNAAVAAEIRAEQARQRVSVQALAEAADIPYGSLRRYLNAKRHIDVAVLHQLASALGVSVLDIVAAAQRAVVDAEVVRPMFGPGSKRAEMTEMTGEAARDED